jgi:hypothetical protein
MVDTAVAITWDTASLTEPINIHLVSGGQTTVTEVITEVAGKNIPFCSNPL